MVKETYNVTGMSCSACSARVEKVVSKIVGAENVSVNLLTNTMQVKRDEKIFPEKIIDAVTNAGYGASLKKSGAKSNVEKKSGPARTIENEISEMKFRLVLSIIFLIPTIYISMHSMFAEMFGLPVPNFIAETFDGKENSVTFAFAQFLLILPIMYLNRKYYVNGFKNLFRGAPNMDSLVGLGSMAAAIFGAFALFRIGQGLGHGNFLLVEEYGKNLYFESAGMIVTLITVGKFLEAKAKGRATKDVESLINLAPKNATVLRDGEEIKIPVEELKVGDEILTRPGEIFAADGIISEGETEVDESAITGESLPATKSVGEKVTGGTINLSGFVKFRAEKIGEDTTVGKIISLVEEAGASKAPIAKTADKIAGIFVPAVIVVALAAGFFWLTFGASVEFAFSIAVSVLVISCPCALGLATPVAITVGIGKGAENGILIKSGEALERAHEIDTAVVDKTGTLTEGKPKVTDVIIFGGDEENFLKLAAGLEMPSEHPLAKSVVKFAEGKNISPRVMKNFKAIFGKGVQAESDGKIFFAGNKKFFSEMNFNLAEVESKIDELTGQGKTTIIFADEKNFLGAIALADAEKFGAADAIKNFQNFGIDVIMLTGDNFNAAKNIADKLGIKKFYAELLPEDKAKKIDELKNSGHKVAMIGDGINDAPALAKSDFGVAIGAGTDVAIESADAVLVRNDLRDAADAVRLSKNIMRNIKENLFWAFFYNVICIPLAAGIFYPAFGLKLSPMIGAAAMSMSSVCVVLNALRLKLFKVEREKNFDVQKIEQPVRIEILNPVENKKEDSSMKTELKIEGMMCKNCQKHVHDALAKMDGVTDVEVSLENKSAEVTSSKEISRDEFAKVITDAGYELI